MKKILLIFLLFLSAAVYSQIDTIPYTEGMLNKAIRNKLNESILDLNLKATTNKPTFTDTVTVTTLRVGSTAITSTPGELNKLTGVTVTTPEINRLTGVGYNIQEQLDAKASAIKPRFTDTMSVEKIRIGTTANSIVFDSIIDRGQGFAIYKNGAPLPPYIDPGRLYSIDSALAVVTAELNARIDSLIDLLGSPNYYIATTGNDGNTGTSASPWKTLAYACSQVTSGTIHVGAGTFTETATSVVAPGVSIVGEGVTSVIKAGYTATDGVFAQSLILLNSAGENTNGNQSISSIKIDGDALTGRYGVYVKNRSNVSIHDITMVDFSDWGVTFGNGDPGTDAAPDTFATGNNIYNCTITNCSKYAIFSRGNIQIGGQEGTLIYNNTITQSTRTYPANGVGIKFFGYGYMKDVRIYNNTVTALNGYWPFAIELWNISGVEIDHNTVKGSIQPAMISKGVYAYGVDIHHNMIGDTAFYTHGSMYGVALEGNAVIGVSDAIVRNNYIRNSTIGIVLMAEPDGLGFNNLDIYNNVVTGLQKFEGFGGIGFWFLHDIDDSIAVNEVNIYNNTFNGGSATDNVGIIIPGNGNTTNFTVRNNIIYGFAFTGIYSSQQQPHGTIDVLNIQNNLIFANGDNTITIDGIVPTNVTGLSPQTNLFEDPDFVSASDLSLQVGSPAINAGYNTGLATDYNDNPRSTIDIGSYEKQP